MWRSSQTAWFTNLPDLHYGEIAFFRIINWPLTEPNEDILASKEFWAKKF